MKSRLAASIALSALVLMSATGCTFLTTQATTIDYSASDGVNIEDTGGPLEIRNAFIVATEDGSVGNLIAAIINETEKSATLTVEVDGGEPLTVRVPAGERVSLGGAEDPLRLDGLDVPPGATVSVYFQSGDATGTKAEIQVLDGTLPYYADLVPDEDPTPAA